MSATWMYLKCILHTQSWEGVVERVTPDEGSVSLLEMETDSRSTSLVGRTESWPSLAEHQNQGRRHEKGFEELQPILKALSALCQSAVDFKVVFSVPQIMSSLSYSQDQNALLNIYTKDLLWQFISITAQARHSELTGPIWFLQMIVLF